MTSIGHIITSLLPQSDCRPLTLVVTVNVQSGGGHRYWQCSEELLNTEEKTIQVINIMCTSLQPWYSSHMT